jgi:NAD kinase
MPKRAPALTLQDIFVVPKNSKLEQICQQTGKSMEEVLKAQTPKDAASLEASHARQLESLEIVKAILPPSQFVTWSEASKQALCASKAVIALGGDGHLNFVGQFLTDQMIIGVNSDPVLSQGDILRYKAQDIPEVIKSLLSGDYHVEYWPRIRAKLGETILPRTVSEIFIGGKEFMIPSRVEIEFKGQTIVNRGNGLVIATGAGSTALCASASAFLGPQGEPFPPSEQKLRFVMALPMRPELKRNVLLAGDILPGEEFKVRLQRGQQPIVKCDGINEYDAKGEWLTVSLSTTPLRVMVPEKKGSVPFTQ